MAMPTRRSAAFQDVSGIGQVDGLLAPRQSVGFATNARQSTSANATHQSNKVELAVFKHLDTQTKKIVFWIKRYLKNMSKLILNLNLS